MAERQTEEGGKVSMTDIAATLLQGQKKAVETAAALEEVAEHDEPEAEEPEADESPTGGEEDDAYAESDHSEEDEGDHDPDEDRDQPDESDGDEYLDVRDDDLITVLVDGEEQEVTIGDLKKAHSGEGAIEKRLQEATEARKAAHAERTQYLEKLANDEQLLLTALNGLDDNLFKPVIQPPPESLRQSNPERYLKHREAYEQDQKRISEAKELLEGKKKEVQEARQQRIRQYADDAAKIIAREIPELADPEKANSTFKKMAEVASAYGYTPQEIDNAIDPRMFMLVRDAMKYRELTQKAQGRNPSDLEGQKQKKVRRLRSGNTQAKTRARQADKQRKETVDRARKTGKVTDVAATLLKPRG